MPPCFNIISLKIAICMQPDPHLGSCMCARTSRKDGKDDTGVADGGIASSWSITLAHLEVDNVRFERQPRAVEP